MGKIKDKIIYENPIFVLILGLCSSLAITTKFENAYIMGICVLLVLLFSSTIVSLTRKIIPDNVKIPVYIIIVATFVTSIEIVLIKYVKDMYDILGVYLPLIVVNCIVLGRCLTVASKEKVLTSIKDALGIGIGYTIALMIIASIREILGSNTITLMDSISSLTGYKAIYTILPNSKIFPIPFFNSPAGAFITIGLLMALFNYLKEKREAKKDESN
ncbi:MAG TPA: electron transport complex subunit RsxE [Tenericutes bacterium]|nr:electron transport complex subunit RsxE [Mycoplasmatota bacterium]